MQTHQKEEATKVERQAKQPYAKPTLAKGPKLAQITAQVTSGQQVTVPD